MESEHGPVLRQGLEQAGMEEMETRRPGRSRKADPQAGADLAHDLRNLAMSVISAANLLQRSSDDPARVVQIATLLRETGERAVAISRGLPPRAAAGRPG
jgi:signal transduction histidine kinase